MFKYFLVFISLLPSISFAQFPQGQRPDSASLANTPKTGIILGSVIDAASGEPVEYAAIAVFSVRDSSLKGGSLSNEKGKFTVTELPAMGRFRIKISFIGYADWQSEPVMLTPQKGSYDIGVVKMNVSGKNLNEVDITAEKSDFQNSIDRKVYNVDKNLVNVGGTATDVLQNVPSVTVDMDGNVSLRGSGAVTVFIDGKPSTLTGGSRQAILQQIPASAIESVEVISNPSAKYDAEGMAGIINIKTKKGKLKGLNGNTTLSVGTNNKYNASVGLNHRGAKLNVFGNYSFRSEERESESNSDQIYKQEITFKEIKSSSEGEQKNVFHTVKAGFDYNLNNQNTIGLSGSYSMRDENDPESNINLINYFSGEDAVSTRYEKSIQDNNTLEGTLDYRRTFKDSKSELTASATYSMSDRGEDNSYSGTSLEVPYQLNNSAATFTSAIAQADYSHPFANAKLETGLKATQRINDNDVHAEVLSDGFYLNDIQYTDHFIYEEDVLAGYALYSGKIKFLDYSAGLRAEQTLTNGDSKTTSVNIDRNYLAFFPSASIKYNWKKSNDLQLSYSRRTNRPNINSLNPFVDYSDTLNIRTGNPYLLPEYIHSAELSYAKTLDKITATATVYYRHIDDVISRYHLVDETTGISTYTVLNFNTADNIGLEGILRYQAKAGSLMWSFNVFQNTVNGSNVDPDITGTNTNWNTRLTANWKLMKNFTAQLTGMYSAPDRQPQRTIRSMMSGVDAGVKYDFWKGKASLGFNVTDIFKTRKFDIHQDQDFYVLDSVRRRESQVATLSFSYRFGAQDNPFALRKKKNNPVQEGGGDNDGGY
ncbi:MAG: TonB-dependent receptor, partial [Bacteroidota bacterium]